MISLQIKPWVAFGFPYLLIELFYIGIPVVRTDGRTVTWLPNFLGWVDYHISLTLGLRPRARFARGWSSAIIYSDSTKILTLASIENLAPSSWETIFRTLLLYACLIMPEKSIVMISIGEIVSKHDSFLPFYNLKMAMSRRRFSRVRQFFRALWRVLMCILVVKKQHPVNRLSCRSLTKK